MARVKGAVSPWERQQRLQKVLESGWVPLDELLKLSSKPERTVRRDLDKLTTMGHIVETRWNGTHKEWRINPDAIKRPIEPGVLELIALTLGRGLLQFLEGTEVQLEMDRLFQALRQASRAPERQREGLDHKFWFMPDAPRDYSGTDDQLNEICTCLLDQRSAEIWYRSRGKSSSFHLIEPYTLVVRRECIYVLAHVPEESQVRLFDLTRIVSIRRLRDRFEVPKDYEPSAPFSQSFGVFIRGEGEVETARVLFPEAVARSIENRAWHPSQRWEQHPQGRVLAIDVRICPELVRWILGFGASARALGPAELVEQVAGAHAEALERYAAAGQ